MDLTDKVEKISYCTIDTFKRNGMFPTLFATPCKTCNFAANY